MKQCPRVAAILVALLSTLLWAGDAGAIIIDFIEPPGDPPGGVVEVRVDLEGLPLIFSTDTPPPTAETASANFILPFIRFDIAETVIGVMLEPGSTREAPVISDLIFASATSSAAGTVPFTILTFSFVSDSESGPLTADLSDVPPEFIVVEDGTLQTIVDFALPLFIGNGGGELGTEQLDNELPIVIRAQSDVDAVAVAPEPSTLLLIGSTLLGIGAVCRRRLRRR